jgi:hypothetical protein
MLIYFMFRLINKVLYNFNLQIIRTKDDYANKLLLYEELFQIQSKVIESSIGCIVFSMDRALQLDGLLRSFFLNKQGECKILVIYTTSKIEHQKAYQDVINRFESKVQFIEEYNGFKQTLLDALDQINTGKLFFLVDDIFFTERVDFDMLSKIDSSKYIFSLRMGNHLNYSYVVDKSQKLPQFIDKDDEFLYWDWSMSEFDWAYPLSVDGHIFGVEEIRLLAGHFDYKAPNSFEEILQSERKLFLKRLGMSNKKARIVNNPCNKVQTEVKNLHGVMHQDDLLNIWNSGQEIDIEVLQGFVNKSVHEDVVFVYKERI